MEGIINALRSIIQELENAKVDKLDLYKLESKLLEAQKVQELKEKSGLEDLYFFKDVYYSGYLCLTKDDMFLLSNEDISHLALDAYDFEQLLENTSKTIKFPKTGKSYYNIENLKHDYLTLKLSGVK